MNFYDDSELWAKRGVDYDLFACLEYNNQGDFMVADIEKVLAVWEGQHDGDDWRWVLKLMDGRFVFLRGGCDYTGWDCQSSASHWFADTPEKAAALEIANDRQYDWHPSARAVCDDLLAQLRAGKSKTWREGKDKEFGL